MHRSTMREKACKTLVTEMEGHLCIEAGKVNSAVPEMIKEAMNNRVHPGLPSILKSDLARMQGR